MESITSKEFLFKNPKVIETDNKKPEKELIEGMFLDTEPIDRNYETISGVRSFEPSEGLQDIFLKYCEPGREIEKYVATARALEMIYTASHWQKEKREHFKKKIISGDITESEFNKEMQDLTYAMLLFNIRSAIGTRNRLRYVIKTLENDLKERLQTQKEMGDEKAIEILSLGAGSGRAILEILIDNHFKDKSIKAILVDRESWAIKYSQAFAKKVGIEHKIDSKKNDVGRYLIRLLKKNTKQQQECPNIQITNPQIIEMVGLIDYLPDEAVIKLLGYIFQILPKGGTLITANIYSTIDKKFLEEVMGWEKMYYRTENQFQFLIRKAMQESNMKIEFTIEHEDNVSEPTEQRTNVYLMAVCKRK